MSELHQLKILIADDEEDSRLCLKSMFLRHYNVEVADVGDGELALARIASFNPDIVLLDIHMPGIDGWSVIREARAANSQVKFIVITGWGSLTEDQRLLVEKHVSAYFPKPVVFGDVAAKVFELMQITSPVPVVAWPDIPVGPGRPEAREVTHTLANMHARIRMKSEYFVTLHDEGRFDGRPPAEVLGQAVQVLKDIIGVIDEAGPVVEKIRSF
jgi:CheY-like chemotaxis protein